MRVLGRGGGIVSAVYGYWLYNRMFLHNFGSVFQFACPPLSTYTVHNGEHASNTICINSFILLKIDLQARLTKSRKTACLQPCFLVDSVSPKTTFSCNRVSPKEDAFPW